MTRLHIRNIEALLADLGVLPPNKHQEYTVKAILMYEDTVPKVIYVYHVVAKACNTTPNAIERGIRVSCHKVITSHNKQLLKEIFGANATDLETITNREFLASIAAYLRRCSNG
jgi:hypothetical protein